MTPARLLTVLTALSLAGTASCSNGATAPDSTTGAAGLPGKRLLAASSYHAWRWIPASGEVVYTTRFDSPYNGPPTRIEAISVATGQVRTITSAPNSIAGSRIIPTFLWVYGSQVYFVVADASYTTNSIFRVPASGGGTPEKLVDYSSGDFTEIAPSSDGSALAWAASTNGLSVITTLDLATRTLRRYPLQKFASRVRWSPSGRTILADQPNLVSTTSPATFQWLDIPTAMVRSSVAPLLDFGQVSAAFGPTAVNIAWNGEAPVLYATDSASIDRFTVTTGAVERLASLAAAGSPIGWTADFSSVIVTTEHCDKYDVGVFGGGNCIQWTITADRVDVRTGTRTSVLRYTGRDPLFMHADPTLTWLGSVYASPTADGGLYIQSLSGAK